MLTVLLLSVLSLTNGYYHLPRHLKTFKIFSHVSQRSIQDNDRNQISTGQHLSFDFELPTHDTMMTQSFLESSNRLVVTLWDSGK
jgi:hypothetical protein